MATKWTLPTTFMQYAETDAESAHVSWNEVDNFSALKNKDGNWVRTSSPLLHIARSPKIDITMKTYYLKLSGFNFTDLPGTISGIEMRLTSERRGRITDDTIELCVGDRIISKNHADLLLDPIKVYGTSSDLWDIESLTIEDLLNPNFGVVVRFKSHPHWPHKEAASIDTVELRIH